MTNQKKHKKTQEFVNLISLSTAGGGKTTRLVKKINELIENGADINRILVISFTKASCEDIKIKINTQVMTLHSFCAAYAIERKNIYENSSVLVSIFLHKYQLLSRLGLDKVSSLYESYLIFQRLPEKYNFLEMRNIVFNTQFAELVEDIAKEKNNRKICFFSDLIFDFLGYDNYEMIYNTFDHILIDETQDFSFYQLELIYKLIEEVFILEDKSFFVVGDIKQSIYSFQGSSPEYYQNFINRLQKLCDQQKRKLIIEKNNKTYRFGGEIITYVNKHFEEHLSDKDDGKLHINHLNKTEIVDELDRLITSLLENYSLNQIMIIYPKNDSTISKIQNNLSALGFNLKIWTKFNKIMEAFSDIYGYMITKLDWYKAKILQGPFFGLTEPHFFILASNRKSFAEYEKDFFLQLPLIRDPSELMDLLFEKIVFCTDIESGFLLKLYETSHSYSSIFEFINNIPQSLHLDRDGILFSTIHSSKGLESDVVIYIKEHNNRERLYVNLNPFWFSFDKIDIDQPDVSNNLEYVAVTRARKELFIYNIM